MKKKDLKKITLSRLCVGIFSFFFLIILFSIFYILFSKPPALASSSPNFTVNIISFCGNNIKEQGEQCDDTDLGGASCASLGFGGGGILSCTGTCAFYTTDCIPSNTEPIIGGGGSGFSAPLTNVIFEGQAYPNSKIFLLKDAQIVAGATAMANGNFTLSITGLAGGNYVFSIYAEDKNKQHSVPFSLPVNILNNAITQISGILISPTIITDKNEVKQGEIVTISGQATPNTNIDILISPAEKIIKITSDQNGNYSYNLDTSLFGYNVTYGAQARAKFGNQTISDWSYPAFFKIGEKTVIIKPSAKCVGRADLNSDCKVNLVDFSIAAFWYKKQLSDSFNITEKELLNGDKKIDLIDFSIIAYYWTG